MSGIRSSSRARCSRSKPSTRAATCFVVGDEERGRALRARRTPRAPRSERNFATCDRFASPFAPHSFVSSDEPVVLRRARTSSGRRGTARTARSRTRRTRSRASPRSRPGSPSRTGGRACRCRTSTSPRRTRCAGTAAAARSCRPPRTRRRRRPPSRRARPRARRTPSRGRAGGTRTAGRRGDPRRASTSRSGSSGRSPPIMQSCLKSCGDCASAKNFPGCRRTGTRKSRAPSGVPRVIAGVQMSTKPSSSIVRRMPETAACDIRRLRCMRSPRMSSQR